MSPTPIVVVPPYAPTDLGDLAADEPADAFRRFTAPEDGPQKIVDVLNAQVELFRSTGLIEESPKALAAESRASASLVYKTFKDGRVLARVAARAHAHLTDVLEADALERWPKERFVTGADGSPRARSDLELAHASLVRFVEGDPDAATMTHLAFLLWRRPLLLLAADDPVATSHDPLERIGRAFDVVPEMRAFYDRLEGLAASAMATNLVHEGWDEPVRLVAALVNHAFYAARWLDESYVGEADPDHDETVAMRADVAARLRREFARLLADGPAG